MTDIRDHHHAVMDATFKGKRPAKDCAYCRSSEWKPIGYQCKRGLPMDAQACPEWRDSRTSSSSAPEFLRDG